MKCDPFWSNALQSKVSDFCETSNFSGNFFDFCFIMFFSSLNERINMYVNLYP